MSIGPGELANELKTLRKGRGLQAPEMVAVVELRAEHLRTQPDPRAQAVAVQLQLVVAHQWVGLDQVVRRSARVVDEAGQRELFAAGVAADLRRTASASYDAKNGLGRKISGVVFAVITRDCPAMLTWLVAVLPLSVV